MELKLVCPPNNIQLMSADIFDSVLEYTYLLFWNSFWTVAPVIGIGLFDRIVGKPGYSPNYLIHISDNCVSDSDVLMNIPELYHYGREGKWFGIRLFAVYMLDGVYQVCFPWFQHLLFSCSHSTRTSRP
jgi:phospholipid-translocating ATPase